MTSKLTQQACSQRGTVVFTSMLRRATSAIAWSSPRGNKWVHSRAFSTFLNGENQSNKSTLNRTKSETHQSSGKKGKQLLNPINPQAKRPKELNDNLVEVDTEDILMAHTDPLGLVSTKYNHAMVRTFKESKLIRTENKLFRGAVRATEKALLALNRKISRATLSTMQVNYLPPSVEWARTRAEVNFLKVIRSVRSEAELKGITAFMTILMPRSSYLWEEFDQQITRRILYNPLQYAELGLLATYSLHHAKQAYTVWSRDKKFSNQHQQANNPQQQQLLGQATSSQSVSTHLKTPAMMIQYYVDLKRKQQVSASGAGANIQHPHAHDNKVSLASNIVMNSEQNIFEMFADDCAAVFTSVSSEVFAPVGALQARDNKAMEILGLQLSLFANYGHILTSDHPSMKQKILEDLSNHCLKVLSSAHTPVKLPTLREIWENAPKIDLPNAYSIYKQLYQQVIYSITTEPLQIVHQDEGICTLFESMIASKFKSSQCINKLYEVVSSRGMDYQKIGVRLFNSLVQLDSIPFATMILDSMMKNAGMKLEYLFTQSSKGKPFLMTDEAKEQVLRTLQQSAVQNFIDGATSSSVTNKFDLEKYGNEDSFGKFGIVKKKTSNLGLALFCFNREEKKSAYYKLLEQLEVSLLAHLQQSAQLNESIGLFNSYALVGRKQPQMMRALDAIIEENFDKLTTKQLSTIIWSCARLNYQPSYLSRAINTYFQEMKSITTLSTPGAYALSRTLWALAVLQRLDIDRFLSVQSLLFKASQLLQGVEMHSWMIKQLTQIETELRIKHQHDSNIEEQLTPLHEFLEKSPTYKNLNKRILRENLSSWTHLDASRVLTEMGIVHENEKLLPNGSVVDMFVPLNDGSFQGIAIEFDGPSHYESYLNVSSITL
jgi:hypothetical protein